MSPSTRNLILDNRVRGGELVDEERLTKQVVRKVHTQMKTNLKLPNIKKNFAEVIFGAKTDFSNKKDEYFLSKLFKPR